MSSQSPDLSITADTVPGRRDALTASPSQAVPATNSPTGGRLPLSATERTRHRRFRHLGRVDRGPPDDGDSRDAALGRSWMKFTFEATPTGSRMTSVTRFSSVDAMEQTVPGMEEGLRAAMPQLDAVLAERGAHAAHA
jgi:hypothetical protein